MNTKATLFYSTNEFTLSKIERNNPTQTTQTAHAPEYKIEWNDPSSEVLLRSLIKSKIIPQSCFPTVTDEYRTLIVHHTEVYSLESWIQHEIQKDRFLQSDRKSLILSLIFSLSKQIEGLKRQDQQSFYAFSKSKILVFVQNQSKKSEPENMPLFIHFSKDHLCKCSVVGGGGKEMMTIHQPFKKEDPDLFLSPEVKKIQRLPQKIDCKTIYHSLGQLVYSLIEELTFFEDKTKMENSEFPLLPSQLHGFLQRLMRENPEEREFLWV